MCLGMANGVKSPEFLTTKKIIDDVGKIAIPNEMLKKVGIVENDVLQLTATDHLIIIEKCESDGEDND